MIVKYNDKLCSYRNKRHDWNSIEYEIIRCHKKKSIENRQKHPDTLYLLHVTFNWYWDFYITRGLHSSWMSEYLHYSLIIVLYKLESSNFTKLNAFKIGNVTQYINIFKLYFLNI